MLGLLVTAAVRHDAPIMVINLPIMVMNLPIADAAACLAAAADTPTTEDKAAERALKVMAVLTATDDAALSGDLKPAYMTGVRDKLKERATRMADLGMFRRTVDACNARNNPEFAKMSLKTVATIMKVYNMGAKDLGLDSGSAVGVSTMMRKDNFTPVMAESIAPIVSALADDNPDSDGLAFIQAVIRATDRLLAMTSAGYQRAFTLGADGSPRYVYINRATGSQEAVSRRRRQPHGATGLPAFLPPHRPHPPTPPRPPTPLQSLQTCPAVVLDAMNALMDVDRKSRLLDDGAVVPGPDTMFLPIYNSECWGAAAAAEGRGGEGEDGEAGYGQCMAAAAVRGCARVRRRGRLRRAPLPSPPPCPLFASASLPRPHCPPPTPHALTRCVCRHRLAAGGPLRDGRHGRGGG